MNISARRNTEEEKDFQEVYFSWSGLGSAVGYASVSSRCSKRESLNIFGQVFMDTTELIPDVGGNRLAQVTHSNCIAVAKNTLSQHGV
jgi:hypothetical protein